VVLSLVGNAKIIRLKIYPQGEQFYTDALSVFWEQVSSGTLVSMHNQLAWKVTMSSWFISPWEVARVSLEAQRLIALQFFPFAPRKEQPHQEEASGDKKAAVPGYRLRRRSTDTAAIEGNRSGKDSGGPQRHGRY
jgi:hypothetical protein